MIHIYLYFMIYSYACKLIVSGMPADMPSLIMLRRMKEFYVKHLQLLE